MFYWMVKFALRPIFWVFFRPRVRGAGHIPTSGGALLASNHLSMCDSLFLPVLIRRRVTFLAKQEYFTGRGLKGRAKAAFVRGTGLIPIDRGNAGAAAAALAAGAHALRRGMLLAVYPEGTRSPDGRLYRGKTGLARLAMETGVPVVPVAMIGTDRVAAHRQGIASTDACGDSLRSADVAAEIEHGRPRQGQPESAGTGVYGPHHGHYRRALRSRARARRRSNLQDARPDRSLGLSVA